VNLVNINLSYNKIKKIEGVSTLTQLKTLDVSHNIITEVENLEEVKELPSLTSLDLSHNYIDDHESIVPFFTQI